LILRPMTEADIADGLRFCRASGWNQREQDWSLLLRLAGGRFRVAIADGRVVATGGAAVYGTRLAWICMILVDPVARGRGIGTRIFEDVLGLLDDVESVGLDATPEGRRVYSKVGFVDAAKLMRMGMLAEPAAFDPGGARPVTPAALPEICELDREAFGADRANVLRWALDQAPEYAWRLDEGGVLSGYCFGRHGHHSEQIGPVVARSAEAARQLVSACLPRADAGRIIVDAPADRPEWIAELRALGFEEQRPLTRMYRASASAPGKRELQFAICGPELG
jgi:GNAT superfamily N-acetyltransferase